MKRARVAAFVAVGIVAAGVATTLFTSQRGGRERASPETPRGAPPSDDPAPSTLPAERTPVESAPDAPDAPGGVPAEETERPRAFDLRGPDDEPLAAASLFVESDGDRSARRGQHRWIAWSRAAPDVALPKWSRWLRAEADSIADELDCRDLVSATIEVAQEVGRSAGEAVVVRLGRRPGIFGRIEGLAAAPACRVVWLEKGALEASEPLPDELRRRGRNKMPRWRGDAEATYELFGLEPGEYLVVLQDELGEVLEPATAVVVADRMVRADLEAKHDESGSLLVHLVGLSEEEAARAEFVWIDGAAPSGGWTPLRRTPAEDDAFRVTPIGAAARATMRRLLAGELAPHEQCALALQRQSRIFAAQPLANGQREATFAVGPDANLTVRVRAGAERLRLRIDVVPASTLALLVGPPASSDDDAWDGATISRRFERLAPGDFVLQIWRPLKSALHHGEVWWPVERRALALHAGDQEVALDAPPLHPLTVRFDRARFGPDAKVQLRLRDYPKQPRYAEPDEQGVARFDDVPRGDFTVAVIGDTAGERDLTVPETSEATIEPTRRER